LSDLRHTVRGEKQWHAALERAAEVTHLEVHGPQDLRMDGLEEMQRLQEVALWNGAPTDQLWRLSALPHLEKVRVTLDTSPADVAALAAVSTKSLEIDAQRARRALEVAALAFARIEGLERLNITNLTTVVLPWNCEWLPASGVRELAVSGFRPDGPASRRALHEAKSLRALWWHGDRGEPSPQWRDELAAALPSAEVRALSWVPAPPALAERWQWGAGETDPDAPAATMLGPREQERLAVSVHDAATLRAFLERWVPDLAVRLTIADEPGGIRIVSSDGFDLMFLQDLLELGTPDVPERAGHGAPQPPLGFGDPAIAAFVATFLADLRSGRIGSDVEEITGAWVAGMTELEAAGVEGLEDTVIREDLCAALEQPLGALGIDAEEVVLAY
jgi:hypothetical protein